MPMLLQHIDAIARQKNRTVLYLRFFDNEAEELLFGFMCDYENHAARKNIVQWLDENKIEYQECDGFAREDSGLMCGYQGMIYIDVPFDIENEMYKKLAAFLETPGGQIRVEHVGTNFLYLPLGIALKNAHHDEPGFWERHYDALDL
jgi:hypothetical protein